MQNNQLNSAIEIIEKKVVYQGYSQLSVYTLKTRLFEGGMSEPYERELFERKEAVSVIPYDPILNKIVLVEQFRMGAIESANPWMLEVVAGIRDKDENLFQLMERELQEESGLDALDSMQIMEYYSSPGGCSEKMTLFCAKVDSTQAGNLCGLAEENENICVHVVDLDKALELLHSNVINNAITIIALQWLENNLEKVRARFLS